MRSDELLMLSYLARDKTQKGKTSTQIESIKLTLYSFINVLRLIYRFGNIQTGQSRLLVNEIFINTECVRFRYLNKIQLYVVRLFMFIF